MVPVVSKATGASDVPDTALAAAWVESVAEAVAAEEWPEGARTDGDEADAGEALARITFGHLDVRFSPAEVGAAKSTGAGDVPEEAAAAEGDAAAAAVEDQPGEGAEVWTARR